MRKFVALGLALMTAAPVAAMAPANAAPQTAQPQAAEAIALARLMSPRDLLVEMEVREFDKHFVSSLRSDPEMKSLDDEYPGVFEAMHKASRGLVSQAMGRSVDQIHLVRRETDRKQLHAGRHCRAVRFLPIAGRPKDDPANGRIRRRRPSLSARRWKSASSS